MKWMDGHGCSPASLTAHSFRLSFPVYLCVVILCRVILFDAIRILYGISIMFCRFGLSLHEFGLDFELMRTMHQSIYVRTMHLRADNAF